ncbi:MAG: outer membrane protein assembly factor BamA, partial [Planctomycetota bacterium]
MDPICRTRCLPALLATLCLAAAPAGAQDAAKANVIVQVGVTGNTFRSDAAVLADVTIRPGQPYDENAVRRDEQRLLKTRRYTRVRAAVTRTGKGVIVTFDVKERPVIEAVVFSGNKAYRDRDLARTITFARGDPVDLFLIQSGQHGIASRYRADGYHRVRVTYDETALTDQNQVIYRIVEGPRAYVRKIRFRGNKGLRDAQLRPVVQSKRRIWPFTAGALDMETAARDAVDLRNFYRSKGYLDAQVARDLAFDGSAAILTFLIEEGPRYRIRRNVFQGVTVFSDAELQRYMKLLPGSCYDELNLRRDRQTVRDLYGEIGYIDMSESVTPAYTAKPGLVDLVYTIREGTQFTVGRIDIRGNTITKDNVIRRQIRYRPGQLYNAAAVAESAQRLRETQLFESVEITPFGDDPEMRNSLVQIREGQTGRFMIGAGVSSNAGLIGRIRFTERNFDPLAWPKSWDDVRRLRGFRGAGQLLRVSAEPGTEFMRFRIDWEEPWLFDKPILLGASVFAFTASRETYDELRWGGLVRLGHRFPNGWYAAVSSRVEGVEIYDIDRRKAPADVRIVSGTNGLAGLKGTLIRDRTDSRWVPSRGDRLSISYEQVVGDFEFGKAIADYRHYWTVYVDEDERKHILAFRAKGERIFGSAPVFERFYGGGLGSLRGFRYRRV